MKRQLKVFLLLLIITGSAGFAGWRVWQAYQKRAAAEQAGPASGAQRGRLIPVSTVKPRTVPVRELLEVTGALKPDEQVDVTSKVTGRVNRLTVKAGDRIARGQVIAELEDAELTQQVRRAGAALAVVKATGQQRSAELQNAKRDADRAKQLFDQGLIAKQDYETRLTAYRVIEAQMALVAAQTEQASAELRELTILKGQMRIVSPLTGYVAEKYVDAGAVVSPSTPIARVVNLSTMVVAANVPEKYLPHVRHGNRAVVTLDAFGEEQFTGRIVRIVPVLDPETRTAQVAIEIPNPSGALKAEMFARVHLDLATTREALVVPRDALVYRGREPGVYLVEENQPVFRAVQTGRTNGADVEIVANLPPDSTVISRGAGMLREGDRIRIVGEGDEDADSAPGATQNHGEPPLNEAQRVRSAS